MVDVPLGIQSYSRQDNLIPETKLVNMFIDVIPPQAEKEGPENIRLQRPGLAPYYEATSGTGGITGIYRQDGVFSGDLFYTYSGNLYRKSTTDTPVNLGAVGASTSPTRWATNSTLLAILTDTGLSLYNGATIIPVTIPVDVPPHVPVDITSINGYFIIACADARWYWIVPGATTIDPLDFATAESSPDGLVGVARVKDEIWFFGTTTVEVWQPTGDLDLILRRANGRQYDKGALDRDSILPFDNSIMWVGNDGIVYRAGDVPMITSAYGIETRIKNRTGNLSALGFSFETHLFYVLKIPGQGTFAYDAATQLWCEFSSFNELNWLPDYAVNYNGITYVSSSSSGKIWTLDPDRSNDDGVILERIVTGTVEFDRKPVRVNNFSMYVGSSADCTFNVRWKDAREDWPVEYIPITARANADIIGIWRTGNAKQPLRSFEVRVTDDVKMRISWAKANELVNFQN